MTAIHTAVRAGILGACLSVVFPATGHGAKSEVETPEQALLDGYEQNQLMADRPFTGAIASSRSELWLLGKTALWHWDLRKNDLQKIRLPIGQNHPGFAALGTDGTSLFAAAKRRLFQFKFGSAKVFRYGLETKPHSKTIGFAGEGENFWWIHSRMMSKVDRYGKRVATKLRGFHLKPSDKAVFFPERHHLWFARGQKLIRLAFSKGKPRKKRTLKLKHDVVDLKRHGSHMVVATAHTVLRLSGDGDILQAIPVEGDRKLTHMDIRANTHAYLFDDALLEVFSLSDQSVSKLHLPVAQLSHVRQLFVQNGIITLLASDGPKVFSLGLGDEH